jgi:hypothetical protein
MLILIAVIAAMSACGLIMTVGLIAIWIHAPWQLALFCSFLAVLVSTSVACITIDTLRDARP